MRLRQVHPQLCHLEGATATSVALLVALLVQDARRGRHPLHVPGADHAASARAIVMSDATLERESDGLEPSVRVDADTAPFGGRRVDVLGVVVEQQEWIELLDDVRDGRELASHAKAVADPMQARRAINAFDFSQARRTPGASSTTPPSTPPFGKRLGKPARAASPACPTSSSQAAARSRAPKANKHCSPR